MSVLRKILLGVVVGASLSIAPAAVKADDYWNGYWSWYDDSYSPYYYRQYRNPGAYYDNNYYGNRYYGNRYDGYYNYPRSQYYGNQNFGYREYNRGGGSVQVGPMRFGWR